MTSVRPQVSVIIPAYGRPEPVAAAVQWLLDQPLHLDVTVVDNDPAMRIESLLPGHPRLRLLQPGFNTGFAGAINRGIDASSGEFVLFHNADLRLDETYLPELLEFMRAHANAGCASGKVLREARAGGCPIIDSAGIVMRRDRGAHDRGEGQPDRGLYDANEETFAVSGAALFARRAALDDIAIDGQYLDEAFFMYKDDIDLCWRMRLRGWECWYVPAAHATHARTSRGVGGSGYLRGFWQYLANERAKPRHVRVHSMKNEVLVLLRNDGATSMFSDLLRITLRQLAVTSTTLFLAPGAAFTAINLLVRTIPGALAQRRVIAGRATVAPIDIRRRWFRP